MFAMCDTYARWRLGVAGGFVVGTFNADYAFCTAGRDPTVPACERKGIALGGSFYRLYSLSEKLSVGFGVNFNVPVMFTGGSLNETPLFYSSAHVLGQIMYGDPFADGIAPIIAVGAGLTVAAKLGVCINDITILAGYDLLDEIPVFSDRDIFTHKLTADIGYLLRV